MRQAKIFLEETRGQTGRFPNSNAVVTGGWPTSAMKGFRCHPLSGLTHARVKIPTRLLVPLEFIFGSCDRKERQETVTKGYRPALDAFSCSRFSGAIHFPERCASATKACAFSYSRVWFK
jgi:hypothetical protein